MARGLPTEPSQLTFCHFSQLVDILVLYFVNVENTVLHKYKGQNDRGIFMAFQKYLEVLS